MLLGEEVGIGKVVVVEDGVCGADLLQCFLNVGALTLKRKNKVTTCLSPKVRNNVRRL